jgi:hypothetical protein
MLLNDGQPSADFTARNTLPVRSLQSDRKRRWSLRKYVSDIGLGKLRNITANSCHKLELQPSSEYCACQKQSMRVSCRRHPVNVLLYQKIPKTYENVNSDKWNTKYVQVLLSQCPRSNAYSENQVLDRGHNIKIGLKVTRGDEIHHMLVEKSVK